MPDDDVGDSAANEGRQPKARIRGSYPGAMREMPHGMKVVVSICLALLALFFALKAADLVYGEILIKTARADVLATITSKATTHGRGGYSYLVSYSFHVIDKAYGRTEAFGLFPKKTALRKSIYDSLEAGSDYEVMYSSLDPRISRPANEMFSTSKLLLYALVALIAGFMAVNELKSLGKDGPSQKRGGRSQP